MPPRLAGSEPGANVSGFRPAAARKSAAPRKAAPASLDTHPMKVTARGPSNVALVKYWGKRDADLNVPATGSISVTLAGLETTATVETLADAVHDEIVVEGRRDDAAVRRVQAFVDLVRRHFGRTARVRIESGNNFPTGAGLASSASAFAALAVALDRAFALDLDRAGLSRLARRGSGSAARSVVAGFAEMRAGERPDGEDAYAVPLGPVDLLPLEIVVAVTTRAPKAVASTEGMTRTRETSPFHAAWVQQTERDLATMRAALEARDLPRVGHLAELNAMRMHASMLASDPPLLYWLPATLAVIRAVAAARADDLGAWVTIDAGPQVKVLCEAADADEIEARIAAVDGVETTLRTRPGPGASVVEATP